MTFIRCYYLTLITLLSVTCSTQEKSNTDEKVNTLKKEADKEVFDYIYVNPKDVKKNYKNPRQVFDSIYINRIDTNEQARQKRAFKFEIDKTNDEFKKNKPKSWRNVKYKYVKAYLYDFGEWDIVYDGKHLVPDIFAMKTLTDAQAQEIYKIFTQAQDTAGEMVQAACYMPRHGIVFYDAQNQIVAYISICFECNRTSAIPSDGYQGTLHYKPFFEKLGFPILGYNEVQEYIQLLRKVSK